MARVNTQIKFTYEDYKNLPESETKRYELLEGELVMVPSPGFAHQMISWNIGFLLGKFIKEQDLGIVLSAPFDVVLSQENVLQPDLLFVSKDCMDIITDLNIQGAPDLVVEIFSPSTADRDRTYKKILYARYGVKECWLVDPEEKTVEVWALGERGYERKALYREREALASPLLIGFRMDLREVF